MPPRKYCYKILLIRTDRIGDVLLSTPAIKAVRRHFPSAHIGVMVRPYAKEIVLGSPYIDEVILYDKDSRHKSVFSSLKFAFNLRKKRFDLSLILHPTNRVNIISFLAGIPKRIGWNRKMGFLLTKKIEDKKHLGEKHELEYSLDIIRAIGIETQDKALSIPLRKDHRKNIEEFFEKNNIGDKDRLIAINPTASCPSKTWPIENFIALSAELIKRYNAKILIVSGPEDVKKTKGLAASLKKDVIDASGKTSVGQLAWLLRKAVVFISNDSGPVHIATAVGTPVIAIFGRAQPGLSPRRWGPLGERDIFLHKDVGCEICLAHNCEKEFACLKAIEVKDVLDAVEKFHDII